MQEQYNAVIEQVEQNKLDKEEFRGFAFRYTALMRKHEGFPF